MNNVEMSSAIDEAAIQEAMEDVGLKASDLNDPGCIEINTTTEISDLNHNKDAVITAGTKQPEEERVESSTSEEAEVKETAEESSDAMEAATEEIVTTEETIENVIQVDMIDKSDELEKPPDLEQLSELDDPTKTEESKSKEDTNSSEKLEEKREEAAVDDKEKEEDSIKVVMPGTPALRRSSRTKLPNSPAESGAVGRTTRSQNNPEILAKQKSFMQKYQIAVKSPMEEYVRNATQGDGDKHETNNKRKWEDSGGDSLPSDSPPVLEKRLRRSTNALATSKVAHFLELQDRALFFKNID